jgi:hypothetical protein
LRINFAHIRERATSGGSIDFAVFDARSTSGSARDNADLLAQLTAKAARLNLKIDQSALAYMESGRLKFCGTPNLVTYLSNAGLPPWTHYLDV